MVPELLISPSELLVMVPSSCKVPPLFMVPPELLLMSASLFMVPEFSMRPLLVIVTPGAMVSVTPALTFHVSPGPIVASVVIVVSLVKSLKLPLMLDRKW